MSGFDGRVCDQHRAPCIRVYADEPKVRTAVQVLEQPLAFADDDGVNEYPIFVDEAGVCERSDQCRAAERNDVATIAVLHLLDLLFDSGAGELCRRFELSPLQTLDWMSAGYNEFRSTVDLLSYAQDDLRHLGPFVYLRPLPHEVFVRGASQQDAINV